MKLVTFGIVALLLLCSVSAKSSRRRNRIFKKYNSYGYPFKWDDNTRRCGYEGCPKPKADMLNVHILPHTHDDVGWLKTVDQYYYGSKNKVQYAGVQYILDSVISELISDPEKKFIYVESAFFFKWWDEQTVRLQEQVKQLVNEGRLEFVGGAWSMNDEANVHYQSVIDHFTLGLRRLNDTFGECARPRIGWQIDPFGHSREMASMLAQMGYDGLFFGRIDYQDKINRLLKKSMEFVWHGSTNLGEKSDIFSGLLYNQYQAPSGFCFDILCSDEPIIDGKDSPDYNVDKRVGEFLEYVVKQSTYFKTNNVIITMGGDFTYMAAHIYYKNLDKMIRYANERQVNGSKINLFYSTPSCYLKALHDANISWPTKGDDFFPYSSDPHAFWTGYFTSRPTLKRMERNGNHILQICKQLSALTQQKNHNYEANLSLLKEAMGIMQHHDAITGTEKQNVAEDYAFILHQAMEACGANIRDALNQLTTGQSTDSNLKNKSNSEQKYDIFDFESCHSLNISQCTTSERSENFVVTLYNPLPYSTFQYIRIPVNDGNYSIKDYKGVPVLMQTVPIPSSIQGLHFRRSNATVELVFLANELPPLGYKSYFVSRNITKKDPEVMLMDQGVHKSKYTSKVETTIGNKYLTLVFHDNGQLSQVSSNGVVSKLNQAFYYYKAALGNNEVFENRSSGAYIFRPNDTTTEQIISDKVLIRVYRGPVVDEVHQIFNDWLSQVVRVYKEENYAEFEWLVGEIPIQDKIGKEVITRFYTDIKSDGKFETDSNGREMLTRIRNYRETWAVYLQEQIAGNYYPITTKIAIEDESMRLAILTDRAQGGSSLEDGALEIMLHRRLLFDDAFGVGEALNETAYGKGLIVRGQHYLMFGSKKSTSPSMEAQERFVQQKKVLPNWIFFSDASNLNFEEWQEKYNHVFSGLSLSLPQNVNLMSLEPVNENSILIRFEHILEKDEDSEYSQPAIFNLKDILHNYDISDIRETTLAGNQWLDESIRLKFKEDDQEYIRKVEEELQTKTENIEIIINLDPSKSQSKSHQINRIRQDNDEEQLLDNAYWNDKHLETNSKSNDINNATPNDLYTITLQPMQIRTFIITLEWRP